VRARAVPTYINEIRVSADARRFVCLGDTDDIFVIGIDVRCDGSVKCDRVAQRTFMPSVTGQQGPGGFSAVRRVSVCVRSRVTCGVGMGA
jgi:hypothetical protein